MEIATRIFNGAFKLMKIVIWLTVIKIFYINLVIYIIVYKRLMAIYQIYSYTLIDGSLYGVDDGSGREQASSKIS